MKKQKFLLIILGVILLPSCVTVKPSRGISVSGSFYKSENKVVKEDANNPIKNEKSIIDN